MTPDPTPPPTEPAPTEPATGLRRFFPPLLREQQFRRFWIGQTISAFGDQITYLALPIVAVLVLHADAAQMGLLTAIGLLPHLLFSLPAGIWLDRVRRRQEPRTPSPSSPATRRPAAATGPASPE